MPTVPVPAEDLTQDQILNFLIHHALRMEIAMADLSTEVQEIKAAVTGLLDRLNPTLDALLADVAAGQAALEAFAAADATEDATYEQAIADLRAQLEASVAASQAAADELSPLSDSLNAALQPPVEEPPAEEPAVEEPPVALEP